MVNARLEIRGVNIPLTDLIPVAVTLQINDIREPDQRKATSSKTITAKGTGPLNQLFGFIFEINSYNEDPSFNPNKKIAATYWVNDVPILFGNVQLLEIRVNNDIEYDLYFVSNNGNFFPGLANKYLTDIDFSDLNHTFNNTTDKYNPTLGVGYVYPFIDYGDTGFPLTNDWKFTSLKPCIFEREYLRRIFDAEGKTWTSDYLDSNEYKRVIIPDSREGVLRSSDSPTSNFSVEANILSNEDGTPHNAVHLGSGIWRLSTSFENYDNPVPIDNEVSDPSNSYNNTTFEWTCQAGGEYSFDNWIEYNIILTTSNSADQATGAIYLEMTLWRSDDSGASWYQVDIKNPVVTFPNPGSPVNTFTSVNANANPGSGYTSNFSSGHKVKLVVRAVSTGVNPNTVTLTNGGSPVTTGTVASFIRYKVGTEFHAVANSISLQYGETVPMNRIVPTGITQLDFIKGILMCEYLYIEHNPEDENDFIIMPRDEYHDSGEVEDWTGKIDFGRGLRILPMGELTAKRYVYQYKHDSDQYNEDYLKATGDVYGSYTKEVDNDFLVETKIIEPVFSPTVGVGTGVNDIVAPRFWTKKSDTEVQPTKVNIRRLIWGGILPTSPYNFDVNGSVSTAITYPYCGMVDNPFAPTYDINFGLPEYIYWKLTGTYTLNNRYNVRYSRMMNEITDRNSKVVYLWATVTEQDLYNFRFNKILFIKDSYFIINKLIDYDPQVKEPIEMELLKLTKFGVDESGSFELIDDPNDISARTPVFVNTGLGTNQPQNEVIFIGENNLVSNEFDFDNIIEFE